MFVDVVFRTWNFLILDFAIEKFMVLRRLIAMLYGFHKFIIFSVRSSEY